MSAAGAPAAPDAQAGPGRWLPLLLAAVALLPDPWAALPLRTYYFRDFGIAFLPWRLFAASELRAGRLAAWNPFDFEGSFLAPSFYPPDLLHALWPSPVFVSWLLTLHLPLAALAAYWLARELGLPRAAAFVAGSAFALGGLAVSSLNLYVYLQALALTPLVAGWLRRAALGGWRAVAVAGVLTAAIVSTLAIEFVAQAVMLGVALGLAARPTRGAAARLAVAAALAVGLAALPIALTLGFLPETVRGAGFEPEVALANSVHPAALAQCVLPRLFGLPSAPAEAWWGGRFFSKGLPYFLSLYEGPVVFLLAALGAASAPRRVGAVLVAGGVLGLAVALGPWGGLSPWLLRLPLAGAVRFPSKALLTAHVALCLLAAFGAQGLLRAPVAWRRVPWLMAPPAAAAVALLTLPLARPSALGVWLAAPPRLHGPLAAAVRGDAAVLLGVAVALIGLAVAVRTGRLTPGLALALATAVAVADLARAASGVNPQVDRSYFELLPELRALALDDPDRGRVFSFGVDHSPAFRRLLARGGPGLTLAGSFTNRQLLAPWTNLLDRVETPEGGDPALAVPRARELGAEDFAPEAAQRLIPWLRNAAVGRVLSLDPLEPADLQLVGRVPVGPPGLDIHVYELRAPSARAWVACRVALVPDPTAAIVHPYEPGRPEGEVALETPVPVACGGGRARRVEWLPSSERYSVTADGAALLVVRGSFARGWRARVDGRTAPVLRADGKHRAVAFPAGSHDVRLSYAAPGLGAGLWTTLAGCVAALAVWLVPRR